jgi:hypothetical protein
MRKLLAVMTVRGFVTNPAFVSTELRPGEVARRLDCGSDGSSSLIVQRESVGTNWSLRSLDSLR